MLVLYHIILVLSRLLCLFKSFYDYNIGMKTRISIKIRELRKEFHLNQQELAEACNVQQSCISKWERGETLPDAEMIMTLCDIFSVSADYLLGRTDY